MPTNTKALQVAEPVAQIAGKNAVINGGFDIWQRGTSFSLAASTAYTSGFTADRWQTATGANQATTISRQATGDTTNLPNIQYCLRFQRNSGQTGTGVYALVQNFESVNSIPFAGKTITLSFYARAGANYSATSSVLQAQVISGTGTDQNAFAGYTGGVNVISQNATLTTTWQRFSYSGTVGVTATELETQFNFTPTGTAGANDYFEVTGVQLELGNTATPFSRAGGDIQGELAACQRYYYLQTTGSGVAMSLCLTYSSTLMIAVIPFPVSMRTAPTVVAASGTNYYSIDAAGGNTYNFSAPTLAGTAQANAIRIDATISGATAGQAGYLRSNSASSSLAFSAEL